MFITWLGMSQGWRNKKLEAGGLTLTRSLRDRHRFSLSILTYLRTDLLTYLLTYNVTLLAPEKQW